MLPDSFVEGTTNWVAPSSYFTSNLPVPFRNPRSLTYHQRLILQPIIIILSILVLQLLTFAFFKRHFIHSFRAQRHRATQLYYGGPSELVGNQHSDGREKWYPAWEPSAFPAVCACTESALNDIIVATAERGRTIEAAHAKLSYAFSTQIFD